MVNTYRPRALVVDLARYYGGAEVRVLQLAREIGPERCRVVCLRGSPLAKQLSGAGLAVYELRQDKTNPTLAFSMKNILQEGGFDLVDTHNVQSRGWLATCTSGLQKRPATVATVHSSIHQEHRCTPKGQFYHWVERSLLPTYDQVVTVSAHLRAELVGWKIKPERLSIAPNGVAIQRATESEGLQARLELGLKPEAPVIGCVGRLEPAKGHRFLLEAIAKLLPDWPLLQCVLVGEGRSHEQLVQQAERLGLSRQVHFTGFRSDIPRLLAAFDIFALPSLTEGIPFALLEACGCAKPVVASRVGGIPEVVTDGLSGRLVEPGDVPGLALAIDGLLRDPELASRLGEQAMREVQERFSVANMVQCTEQAYLAAIERHQARLS